MLILLTYLALRYLGYYANTHIFVILICFPENFIGFASLPEQIHRKSVKRGFEFTLMVVGESGLGKSTLINSLFLTDLYKDRALPPVEERCQKTTRIDRKTLQVKQHQLNMEKLLSSYLTLSLLFYNFHQLSDRRKRSPIEIEYRGYAWFW